MKKLYIILIMMLLPYGLCAQHADQAKAIIEKIEKTMREAGGIRASFEGSNNGLLLMDGIKFYLNCNGIQTWYNGKTQWSYVMDSEEVNISNPTLEELQTINPYILLQTYKEGFHYQYNGNKKINGRKGYEIELFPKEKTNYSSVILFVSDQFIPLNIQIKSEQQEPIVFRITSFQMHQRLIDEMFEFDSGKYPQAEIIDLR